MALCMAEIMDGRATDAQIGAFLTALRLKGESVEGLGGGFRYCRLGEPLFDERGQIRETAHGFFAARVPQTIAGCSCASGREAAGMQNGIRINYTRRRYNCSRIRARILQGRARRQALVGGRRAVGDFPRLPPLSSSMRGEPPQG
jgi:hypothetical protein